MTKALIFVVVAATAIGSPARADSSLSVTLTAHVDPFCRIYPPSDDTLNVVNGSATIGQVREVCNTPDGYDVATQFSNVVSGRLLVNGSAYQLADGLALRSSNQPAARNTLWQLANAQLASNDAPVIMRVTITPR